jgi:hypothetical protein
LRLEVAGGPGKISSGRNKSPLGSWSTSLRLEVAGGLGKSSTGKNGLFFFLFDVFDFSRNSGRLTDF